MNTHEDLSNWDSTVLVTGGAGFIGSALVRHLISTTGCRVVSVDKLGYASSYEALAEVNGNLRHRLEVLDICNQDALTKLIHEEEPEAIFHLAAESHVDRSIDGPAEFLRSNVVGTFSLLESARKYLASATKEQKEKFRLLHVSTDEVFGELGKNGRFSETTPYNPRSPYSATKAASDHLVRSWHSTYKLPVVLTNCSNNYGPYQFPEKLIPLLIGQALSGAPLPIYGDGSNIRDWIYVDDHVKGLILVLREGRTGESYNIGANQEISNYNLANMICGILDELLPGSGHVPHKNLIEFVTDRPGHDFRYSIDVTKISIELSWKAEILLEQGLRQTVKWYLDNREWRSKIHEKAYKGQRLGLLSD